MIRNTAGRGLAPAGPALAIVVAFSAVAFWGSGFVGNARGAPQQTTVPAPATAAEAADPLFREPFVDLEEWRETPVRHRYVHGGFRGTQALFSIYFPPKEKYQGRFFQHITPIPSSENLAAQSTGEDNKIAFSIESGGYFLETNEGGMAALGRDSSLAAYRVNAAAARYSRILAAQMYGPHRTYGYAFGGSGGGYRTIGGIENTVGAWDGVVPYVIGSPMALPSVFTARLLAMRVLKDKFPAILDSVEPGGSGDPYVGLNPEERDVLTEVSGMGFPTRAWFSYKTLGMGSFPILFGSVVQKDPGYFEDFWKVPGYAGANPSVSLQRARIQHRTTIRKILTQRRPPSSAWFRCQYCRRGRRAAAWTGRGSNCWEQRRDSKWNVHPTAISKGPIWS